MFQEKVISIVCKQRSSNIQIAGVPEKQMKQIKKKNLKTINQDNFIEIKSDLNAHIERACHVSDKIDQHQDIFY